MDEKIQAVLNFWFGESNEADIPSKERTALWFGEDPVIDQLVQTKFKDDFNAVLKGGYDNWQATPRGSLALIIMLDQLSRKIYRNQAQAYGQDSKALQLCLDGLKQEHDHALTLMERVFYYMPLQHAESLEMQATSVRVYQSLHHLALSETSELFKTFFAIALQHAEVIKKFGRFPERNGILGRESSKEELDFLHLARGE